MDIVKQIGPWFILLTVVSMYSLYALVRTKQKEEKGWPPGHPWSGISLLLLAFQQLAWQYHVIEPGSVWNAALSIVAGITSLLWIWAGICDYRRIKQKTKSEIP